MPPVLIVGGPPRKEYRVHRERSDGKDIQNADIEVGGDDETVDRLTKDRETGISCEGHSDKCAERDGDGDRRRQQVQEGLDARRSEVFLGDQLDDVDHGLQQTEGADPIGPEAILYESRATPLHPHHDRYRGQHNGQHEGQLDGDDCDISPHRAPPC